MQTISFSFRRDSKSGYPIQFPYKQYNDHKDLQNIKRIVDALYPQIDAIAGPGAAAGFAL